MDKVFMKYSRCTSVIVVFIFLLGSGGLLVFVSKDQFQHGSPLTSAIVNVSTVLSRGLTSAVNPHTLPKSLVKRSVSGLTDVENATESSENDETSTWDNFRQNGSTLTFATLNVSNVLPRGLDGAVNQSIDEWSVLRKALLQNTTTTESPEEKTSTWENFRLPMYIIPLHYELLLHPNIENDNFTGRVNIKVNVTNNTNMIIVHSHGLYIQEFKVFEYKTGIEISVARAFYKKHPLQFFIIETLKTVEPGIYKLSYEFSGRLGYIYGLFKGSYRDRHNKTRYYVASKFQPTFAREAFPCFDEPSFKSTFTVSLVHEPGYKALSNMPVDVTKQYLDTELLITSFQTSVPMVTYLPCFVICDFDFVRTSSAGKEFRVYSEPDKINSTEHGLKFGSRALQYFENYFGIDYHLPKLDMIAFNKWYSSATEHWGIITYHENFLLYDASRITIRSKQKLTTVISHEMVHMWFGNLVTIEWWNDIWLHEGFASYLEYKGVHDQFPEYDILSQFLPEDMHPVMNMDCTMSTTPVIKNASLPHQIRGTFGSTTYKKGASVLRMLEFFLGEDNFQRGISQFLKKYQFKHVVTADLWEELSAECGYQGNRSIASIMKTWTEQIGFPFITIKRLRSFENTSVFVAKQKLFIKYDQSLNNSEQYVWSVPLSYIAADGHSDIVWIHDKEEVEFAVPVQEKDWVKFNVNQTGYYLVNYDNNEWDKLIQVLKANHELLSPSDRSNFLYDACLLNEAYHTPIDVFLSISSYLRNETHLVPWGTAYTCFIRLCQLLENTDINSLFKSYLRDLTNSIYKKVGWKDGDNHLLNLLRPNVIELACLSGNKDCLSHAAELFQNWTKGQEMPSEMRKLVLKYGMAEIGQEEHWNYVWNKFLSEASGEERGNLLTSLAQARAPELIRRYIKYVIENGQHNQFSNMVENPVGRPFVWNLLKEKWSALKRNHTVYDGQLGGVMLKLSTYFTSDHELEQVKALYSKYPVEEDYQRKDVLEKIQNNIKWMKMYKQSVKKWLLEEGIPSWYYHRLPTYIVPEHYDVTFYPKLDKDVFTGRTSITVSLKRPSEYILVHALNLNVSKTVIKSLKDDSTVEIEKMFRYDDYDYLVLKVEKKLPVGRYKLFFEFEGPFTLSLKGLYKSSYVNPDTKKTRYLATTQFEATHARKAFPCFDEPSFRTTFNVRIIHDKDHFALSNAPVEEIVDIGNELFETRFEKTFPMSTYLLCIVVCDFKYKEIITDNGVKFRIYTAPHLVDKVDYALDIGSKILTYFETYFDVPFPLKKLDMIGIPDFGGGMEHWGLITFREKFLVNTNESPIAAKHPAVDLIAHEIAHMWFGDLVTMEWWDDLWLNEGFASYMSQKGLKHAEPEFDVENHELSYTLYTAMLTDRTVNSHPIIQQVVRVTSALFDDITYLKGSSVLMMLENYMGEDFRKGISAYLKKHALSNARTGDLWTELTAASSQGLNVTFIMETWTKQMNYPFISVMRDNEERDAVHDVKYSIQQRRFLEDPSTTIYSAHTAPFDYVWQVPVTYRTSDAEEAQYLLLNSSDTVTLEIPKSKWVKFNVNYTGYYLVNYDVQDWKVFVDILKNSFQDFSPSDRINLLFDSFSLASAGHLNYEIPLSMTSYLRNETYHGAWELAMMQLDTTKRYFKNDTEVNEIIQEHIRSLTKPLLRKYNWKNSPEGYTEEKLRHSLIDAACNNGHHECLLTAGNLFKHWMKEGVSLDREIRDLVYIHGLRVINDEESWEFLWKKYLSEKDLNEKEILQKALALVRNSTQLERFIEAARNRSVVRKHEYLPVLSLIAESNHQEGFSLITSLIFKNWTEIVKNHGSHRAEKFAYNVFKLYDSEKDLKKVREFYKQNKVTKDGGIFRTLTTESILANIRWLKMHKKTVTEWFKNNVFMPWREFRLPRHIMPTKYNITLRPNITQAVFEGEEEIVVTLSEPTNYILVHEIALKLISTEIVSLKTGEIIPIEEEFPFKRNEYHVIILKKTIPEGEYVLRFNFSGIIEDDIDGLGRYHYQRRSDNSTRYYLASSFEPTAARRAFPCFDEPDMKATFKVTLFHDDNHTALSNMPVESSTLLAGKIVQTVFQESVKMSTYLVCCVIGDFDYIERDYNGKKVRAYAPPDRLQKTEYGLNVTLKYLGKFEEYFQVPYTLPKLGRKRPGDIQKLHGSTSSVVMVINADSVVLPEYNAPAMENWGIITYTESSFFVKEGGRDPIFYADIIIAHELAHQWFGNLVTMKWWNDLWLNEGFSTFIMYMPLRDSYPEADALEVKQISKLMCTDSSVLSHPVRIGNESNYPDFDFFDSLTYDKGGAVLKMLQYTLKEDFRKGLLNYLRKYAFKNAETKDLWEELSNASDMDLNITEMMDTWTLQMGFPYVELKRNENTLQATQRWFLRKKNDTAATLLTQDKELSPYGFVWTVPLVYKDLSTGNEHTLWLKDRNATFEVSAREGDIMKFNPGFVGYYLVKYDEDDYHRIGKHLLEDHTAFSTIDRYNLIQDAFLLAESGRLSYDKAFEFTKYMEQEKELLPWGMLSDNFINLLAMLDAKSETTVLLKSYIKKLTANLYDEVVLPESFKTHATKSKWDRPNCFFFFQDLDFVSTIADLACLSSNAKCIETMSNELDLWIRGYNITTDLGQVLAIAVPSYKNKSLWDVLYRKAVHSNAPVDEKSNIVIGLVSFTSRTEILKTIKIMMRDPNIHIKTAEIMFAKLLTHDVASPLLWSYVKVNWESVLRRFDVPNNTKIISVLCRAIKTRCDLEDFIWFLKSVPQIDGNVMEECMKDIQEAVDWSEKHEQILHDWLYNNLK